MSTHNSKPLDYRTANEVLKKETESQDGIDVQTLIDSKSRGGLTYNDFLILPGHIGQHASTIHTPRLVD